jgi:hypothetical protein
MVLWTERDTIITDINSFETKGRLDLMKILPVKVSFMRNENRKKFISGKLSVNGPLNIELAERLCDNLEVALEIRESVYHGSNGCLRITGNPSKLFQLLQKKAGKELGLEEAVNLTMALGTILV